MDVRQAVLVEAEEVQDGPDRAVLVAGGSNADHQWVERDPADLTVLLQPRAVLEVGDPLDGVGVERSVRC